MLEYFQFKKSNLGEEDWDSFVDQSDNGILFHKRAFLNYHPKDRFEDTIHLDLGVKIVYGNILVLPGGYLLGYGSKNFPGGVGLKWGSLNFDYALSPFSLELGVGYSVSIGFRF